MYARLAEMTLISESREKQHSHDAYPEPHTASSGSTHHLVFRLEIKHMVGNRAITKIKCENCLVKIRIHERL